MIFMKIELRNFRNKLRQLLVSYERFPSLRHNQHLDTTVTSTQGPLFFSPQNPSLRQKKPQLSHYVQNKFLENIESWFQNSKYKNASPKFSKKTYFSNRGNTADLTFLGH